MPKLEAKLVAAAEHCCVVLQTLRNGVPVTVELVGKGRSAGATRLANAGHLS